MKITLEKLRQIVTEEVIKEELAPEIAAPAIAAMLQGMQAETTSDVFGAAFDQLYGEGALEGEAERQAAMDEPEQEEIPTDYQAGGAYGDRPQIGFKEGIEKIIKHEFGVLLKEMYNFEDMSDSELVEQAHQDGIEEFIVLDSEGDLVNREEIIEALNNIGQSLDEDRSEPDAGWWYRAFGTIIEDQIGYGEPTPEQAAAIIGGLQQNIDYYRKSVKPRRPAGGGLGGPGGNPRYPSEDEIAAAGGTPYMEGLELSEDMVSREDIAALRQRVGNMSYEIERMLVALLKAGYSMDDIMEMAGELRKMDPHPADVQVAERKLSKSEEREKEKVVKGMKKSKKDFEKRYGDDAESVMYATATKMAKEKKE